MDTFRVDLRGVVDLLSHHLYSSPRVYVRELVQNAVDAITARRLLDPDAPGTVTAELGTGPRPSLVLRDTGVGLTADEVRSLLATIGSSSKRDDYAFARAEFLGRFGIGLLSCFLVADEIVVRSRSARDPDAPTVLWRGHSDGTYELVTADDALDAPGTEVTLTAARDAETWFEPAVVRDLLTQFASLLQVPVELRGVGVLTGAQPPWEMSDADAGQWCAAEFGFVPSDVVRLQVPLAGVHGVAFVLPTPTNPASRPTHRVHLKRMLLSESVEGLLPEWAFFVRCVIDTDALRPTASREALYDDALLEDTREALGIQLKAWLLRLAVVNPHAMERFLRVHHLGVKAMALHDDEMLALVRDHVPFETSLGNVTFAEFARTFPAVRYTRTVDEFRAISGVATAHGYGVVNAGYVYEEQLLLRLTAGTVTPAEPVDVGELVDLLDTVDVVDEMVARPFLRLAAEALGDRDCEVVVRRFDPASMPSLYLPDPDANGRAVAAADRDTVDELWTGLTDAVEVDAPPARPQFVLNHGNAVIRRLIGVDHPDLVREVVGGLYVQALLHGRHPMRPADTALLNATFLSLVDRALAPRPTDGGPPAR